MACFRRSGMQWGVGETESGQKKQKKNQKKKEGQRDKKGTKKKRREREKETENREGVFSLASITFLRRSLSFTGCRHSR